MSDTEQQWRELIEGIVDGDSRACQQFWDQFGQRLERLASRRLPDALKRRVGPEDVVQSACRSFFRRAQAGEFSLPNSDGLWRLLCAITVAKVRQQVRFHLRKKRAADQEGHFESMAEDSQAAFDPAGDDVSPAEAAAYADEFEKLMGSLDEEERRLVALRLEGRTQDEIAKDLGCAERTVRRILKRVQGRLQRTLLESN